MTMNKEKLYFLYKAASVELFTDFPTFDIGNVDQRRPQEVGQISRRLWVGLMRNRRCAELREMYRDKYVDENGRDEQHEMAIRDAKERAARYQTLLDALAQRLRECDGDDERAGPNELTGEKAQSHRGERRVCARTRPRKRKTLKAEESKLPDEPLFPTAAEMEEFRREAFGEVECFYDRLVLKVRISAQSHVENPPDALISTLVHCMISMYTKKSDKLNYLTSVWWHKALEHMRRVSDDELRSVALPTH